MENSKINPEMAYSNIAMLDRDITRMAWEYFLENADQSLDL